MRDALALDDVRADGLHFLYSERIEESALNFATFAAAVAVVGLAAVDPVVAAVVVAVDLVAVDLAAVDLAAVGFVVVPCVGVLTASFDVLCGC